MREFLNNYLERLRRVLDEVSPEDVGRVAEVLEEAFRHGKSVFICGNGGSATTASHWACDLGKGTVTAGKHGFRVLSIGDNPALLTAYANDCGYDSVFAEPIRSWAEPGDVVILITASGNSPNVLAAAKVAREIGCTTIGLIGFGGGKLASMVDHQITVSCRDYGPVEDLHMILDHVISGFLRQRFAEKRDG
ncbi:MAG: SIS domain-containing protein [bacterium]